MDQLGNVQGVLWIGTTNGTDDNLWSEAELSVFPVSSPIDVQFPSLVNATSMSIWGNISKHVYSLFFLIAMLK